MSVKQYPHFLYMKTMHSETQRDNSGNWIQSDEQYMFHCECREEMNSGVKNSSIAAQDGTQIVYSYIIYAPKNTARLNPGTSVLVMEEKDIDSVKLVEKQVLRFEAGQLACRIWV